MVSIMIKWVSNYESGFLIDFSLLQFTFEDEDKRKINDVLLTGWMNMAPIKQLMPQTQRVSSPYNARIEKLRRVLDESRLEIDDRPVAIVVPFNAAWLKVAIHVDCSLKAAGVDKVFYWALDEKAYSLGREYGLNTYYDNRFQTSSTEDHAEIMTASYTAMMRQRPRFWLDVLNAGYDMIFLDADISVLQSPVQYIQDKINRIRAKGEIVPDITMQVDERHLLSDSNEYYFTKGCAGFFYMRSTAGMKRVMQKLAHFLDRYAEMTSSDKYSSPSKLWHWNDQTGLMYLLDKHALIKSPNGIWNENPYPWVRLEFFDQFDIMNGHMFFNYQNRKRLFATKPKGSIPILVHANGQHFKLMAFNDMAINFFKDASKMTCKPFNEKKFLERVTKRSYLYPFKFTYEQAKAWFQKQYRNIKNLVKKTPNFFKRERVDQ